MFSAVRWTTAATAGRVAIQLAQTAILARLLVPEQFALVAVTGAVIAAAQIFSDLGVSSALFHEREPSPEELSGLYWLNLLTSGGMTLLVALGSSWLSARYGLPELRPLLLAAALSLPITAAGQQLRVQAEKSLEFGRLMRIELASAFFAFLVAVAWASVSPTAFAIIASLLAGATVNTALLWRFRAAGWRPQLRLRLAEVSRFLRFGGFATLSNLVNALNSQLDVLLGGRLLSPAALGHFSVPRDLCLRLGYAVNPAVTRVSLPVLSASQGDRSRLRAIYLQTVRMTTSVNFPLFAVLSVFSREAVELFLGAAWAESAPLLRVLALWGLVRSTGYPAGALLFATGRPDLGLWWNLVMLGVTPPALWVGAASGPQGVVVALLLIQCAFIVPGWAVLIRPLCGASIGAYFGTMAPALFNSAIAGLAAFASVAWIESSVARLAIGCTVFGFVYVASSRLTNRAWLSAMIDLLSPAILRSTPRGADPPESL